VLRRGFTRLAAAAALASAMAGPQVVPASAAVTSEAQSANWAGYVVDGRRFSSISGHWVVPTVGEQNDAFSAFWVGLGGVSSRSRALEQTGTDSDFVGGRARYYAWYELVPAAPVILRLPVRPGDRMAGRVTVRGTAVTVSIANRTAHRSFARTLHMRRPDTSSAEWIAEAPSEVGPSGAIDVLPLADFGRMRFGGAAVRDLAGHAGPISDSRWRAQRIDLVSSSDGANGPPGDQPAPPTGAPAGGGSAGNAAASPLGSRGSTFGVTWLSGPST
jgi:hypothetical protein